MERPEENLPDRSTCVFIKLTDFLMRWIDLEHPIVTRDLFWCKKVLLSASKNHGAGRTERVPGNVGYAGP